MPPELVLHQVGVVGRGDEVVTQRLAHVLVNASAMRVKDVALDRAQVHQETVEAHGVQQLG